MIARCASTADVVEAVRVARAHRPAVSVRGGGHQVAGSAVCDDGLVIDLSAMKGVHVDPTARTVRAQAGATWGGVDRATQLFGLDAAFPAGGRYFFTSHFMDALTDQAIAALLDRDAHRPNPESLIVIRTLGGAIARVGDDESACPHRHARYNLSIDAGWFDPALDTVALGWARSSWDAMAPFATGGVYLNFAGLGDEADRSAVFGRSAERLDRIRRTYDPNGLFAAAANRP